MPWELTCLEIQHPGAALNADQALLERALQGEPVRARWYCVDRPAIVIGFAQRIRATDLVDFERCRDAGIEVLDRQSGGGLVLLDDGMASLSVAVPLPHQLAPPDLTESYRWLGDAFVRALHSLGVTAARRVDVPEARADAAGLDPYTRATCYGGLSPHEVLVGEAKVVGLAQVRRRHAALFVAGVLLRDQSRLVDYMRLDEADRARLRATLRRRTVGLNQLPGREVRPEEVVEAFEAACS